MRAPPALRVECAGAVPWRAAQIGTIGLSAGVCMAWLAMRLDANVGVLAGMVCLATIVGGWSAWRWLDRDAGTLQWDGARWLWQSAGQPSVTVLTAVEVAVDLQAALLLRLRCAGESRPRVRWLYVQRHADPTLWPALCAAIYSHGSENQALAS